MDPFTLAVGSAILAALRAKTGDAADQVLVAWDQTLRAQKGMAGARIGIPPQVKKALTVNRGDRCAYWTLIERCSGTLTVDHRVPLNAGGYNYSDNLQLVCGHHNSSKRARTDLEYRRRNQ